MRYFYYFIGVLLLCGLAAYVSRSVAIINENIDGAIYARQQAVKLANVNIAKVNTDRTALDQYFHLLSVADAPASLTRDRQFQEMSRRHLSVANGLPKPTDASLNSAQAAKWIDFQRVLQEDFTKFHELRLGQVKGLIISIIIVSASLLIPALFFLILPFYQAHRKTLTSIHTSNTKLQRKEIELRATQLTIGNMLEDILYQQKKSTRTSEINARLAAIINSADDAIFSLNLAGFITTANSTATKLFGSHCDGKRFVDLFPSSIATQLKASMMVTEKQNSGSTIDVAIEKNKRRIDLSMTISPIRADDQRLSGFSVIAKDISNSKLEEERFRLAVEAAPNAMIMINSHGYIVLFNSEAEYMFGYKREEIHGKPIHLLLPENLREIHTHHVRSFIAMPSRRYMGESSRNLNGQRKSGEQFPIEVGLTPIQIDDETYVISSIVDISEIIAQRKSLTDLNQELSRKNQEMEQFIYTISHDLKAPLVTIAGFAKNLAQAKDLTLSPQHQHKLDRILANVQSMEALLQDLLHLSRVIKRDLEKTEVDTQSVLDQVFQSIEGMTRKRHVTFNTHKPLKPIYAQESLLFQSLQNIISNSIKYTDLSKNPIIDIESVETSEYIGISVTDNGIGIADKYHERIFNVFERINPEICEGNGVGLSIVKAIMEKHNGKIEFSSTEGKGSTFILMFPKKMKGPHNAYTDS